MSELSIDSMKEKVNIIKKLRETTVFLNNNQRFINPTNLADIMARTDRLEEKARSAFKEDEGLDSLIQQLEAETDKQAELIAHQEKRLKTGEENLNDEDEYKGVVIRGI